MKSKFVLFLIVIMITSVFAGCSQTITSDSTSTSTTPAAGSVNEDTSAVKDTTESSYTTISAADAKEMIDTKTDLIILDVRTKEEFDEGHIQDALLIPYDVITEEADANLPDKEAIILVYCRSGRRSAIAAQALYDLGYTNVYDFGGIIDWTYDVTTD